MKRGTVSQILVVKPQGEAIVKPQGEVVVKPPGEAVFCCVYKAKPEKAEVGVVLLVGGDGVAEVGRNKGGAFDNGIPGFADGSAYDEGFDGQLVKDRVEEFLR
ncbi:hypothetical protein SLA2020_383100 [Shorea laevis]